MPLRAVEMNLPPAERRRARVGVIAISVIALATASLFVFSVIARRFIGTGIEHILTGYDHLAFLAMLMIAAKRLSDLVWVISSFTVAHSLTLTAASLGWIVPNPALIEPLIALTILYVAVENWFTAQPKARLVLTFGFGLIHGLAFASALSDGPLPYREEMVALLSFNLGVEIGQLMFLALAYPLWHIAARFAPIATRRTLSATVALLCVYWLWQRLMPLFT